MIRNVQWKALLKSECSARVHSTTRNLTTTRQGEIKACEKPPIPPQILWVGDCTIATFGNFSASTGKAKSKKTFNITAMVAAAVNNSTVLKYRVSLPNGKRKILYFDTEQSRFHCHNVIERIYRLAGLSDKGR